MTASAIRTFIAVELDNSVKAHIAAVIEFLRAEQIEGLRLARAEGVHLTLKFLGDINTAQVPKVADAMTQVAARQTEFNLNLGMPGVFPNERRARVLWLGVEGDLQPLRLLQADVEEQLTGIGFPAERKRFNPHLTIGRMHHRATQESRRRAADALSYLPSPANQEFSVSAVSLMKSILRLGGAVYERISYSIFPCADT